MNKLISIAPAPSVLNHKRFETLAGEGQWGFVRTALERVRSKKWQWFGVFDDRTAMGGAIVDVTYASKVFLWVYDRQEHHWLLETTKTLGPGMVTVSDDGLPGIVARGAGLHIQRTNDLWRITGAVDGLVLDLALTANGPPMTAVCPTPVGWNVTRKQAGLSAVGTLSGLASREIQGSGLLDHSHGVMARNTSWLWAMGGGRLPDGRAAGFNAISGFNADLENAVWIGDDVFHFETAEITQGKVWRVFAPDVLDLELHVEDTRREDLDLKLVASKYEQPLGVWRGQMAGFDVEFSGVAEDHRARW